MDLLLNPMAVPVLASIVMLLVLASLARHPVPGIVSWLIGCSLLVAAQCAYATRGNLPLLFSMVFANAAFLGGMLLLLDGCLRFFERAARPRVMVGMLIVMTLYNLGPWVGYDRLDHRVIAFSVAHGIVCAAMAGLVWSARPRERPGYAYGLCAGLAAFLTLGHVVRILVYLTLEEPAANARFDSETSKAFVAVGVLGNAALIMSLIVMAHDRLLADIESVAYRDYLTGAASRLAFLQALSGRLARPTLGAPALTLLLLDLDHFKTINDTHGHAAGDIALVHFAALARACLRRDETLGRLGGEEFAILLPHAGPADAIALDARLRQELRQSPALYGQTPLHHGFSAGLAVAEPGDTPDRLMARADAALYRAKHGGRGRLERAHNDGEAQLKSA